MFLSTPSISPDALADIGKITSADLATIALAVNGSFDVRIKELSDLKAEIDKSNTIAKSIAAAAKLEAASASKLDLLVQREAKIEEQEASLAKRETEITLNKAQIAKREEAAAAREDFLAATIIKTEAAQVSAQNRIDHSQNELNMAVAKLTQDRVELEQAKIEFNAKLVALRA
jgi:hypothetical protein